MQTPSLRPVNRPSRLLLPALLAALSPLGAQSPSAAPEVRITEVVANCLFDLPGGFVIEPGGTLEARLFKTSGDSTNPVSIWSSNSAKHKAASDKGGPTSRTASFSAGGFVLAPSDRVKVRLSATLVSKTRDEIARFEAETPEIQLKGAELGRLFLDDVRARGGIVPTRPTTPATGAAAAAPAAARPGVMVRVLGRLKEGVREVDKAPITVRLLDAASAGSGKEPVELGKATANAQFSGDLDGLYIRASFPSVSLKPNARVTVEVSVPVEPSNKEAKRALKPAEGRSQAITVREDVNDLGLVRVSLR